jgi:hypothetical protein
MGAVSFMDNDLKVEYMLARVLYERFCDYKQFTPRKQPYVDPAMLDYASLAVEYLGYDDDAIVRLEERVK